ncbi:MAG: maleate isomerase [Thermococcaceae archaeon]|jgi:maleate isomerase|uniref:Arylmalonate decarboxylase n=1 Tax=Thermococcus sibiricus TaxID=172049 RepID=A0A101EK43_9EURY|nr:MULTISPECIES: aspartate/glutamate racemase family protein [Thermococcus]KUK16637.1 MAG: arylmalonate decarboxylase [Thermococcus sibiricus]MBC7095964.1 aspartate/glutamate racemase family protein [Thermococcus sp.]MDK2983023.1 maleate isomerase [Thermococcaceae archaeon]MDN5321348.1 maleate isomerase [Thermococcaceae archaeon]
MYGWRARIGLIVPSSNTTMEPEFWKMAPEGVSIYTARMNLTDVTEEALIKMEVYARDAAKRLADAEVNIIMYGCTSGSLVKGKGYDKQISQELEKHSGIKTITTSTAVLEALKELGISKVAVATPYIDEVNVKEKQFLEDNGIEVVKIEGLGIVKNTEIGRQEPWVAYNLARRVYTPQVDGVFISCTNFRTIEIIDALERDLGVPVITSNQASMWFTLRNLGIKEDYHEYGILMKEHL